MSVMPFLKMLVPRSNINETIKSQSTDAGDMLVAAGMAPYEEVTRRGNGFHCTATVATAAAVAIPTTDCGISIWNAAEDGGKSIVIDAVYAINAAGHGTALGQAGLMCIVGQTDVAKIGSAWLVARKNNGNGPAAGTVAVITAGATALDAVTGVAIGWIPVGTTGKISVTNLPGLILYADIGGRIIVPPARLFAVQVIGTYIEQTFYCGVEWHEDELEIG